MTLASPCSGRCAVDENRVCRGCHRTLGEIAAWPAASDEQKRQILAAVAQRVGDHKPAGEPPVCSATILRCAVDG